MNINVNYDEVRAGSQFLKQKSADYDGTIQSIYARMHEMSAIWQGSDNQAFISQLESFQPQLNRMTEIINEYASYLQKSADAYEQMQQDRIQQARNLA